MAVFWKPNTLFCEGKDKKMSIGRVSMLLVLAPALHLWWTGADIQTHHLYVLGLLLAYNFGKKLAPIIVSLAEAGKALKGLFTNNV